MPSAIYKLTGDGSVARFLSSNQPSTDALNALGRWRAARGGRAFKVLEDEPDQLTVKITVEDGYANAGESLQAIAGGLGVQYEWVSGATDATD
jgi:hypothetical protein